MLPDKWISNLCFTILLNFNMESAIAAQCIVEQDTGLVLDMAGNKLPAGSVIMCKLTAFVIMEDSDIDYTGRGKMKMVYQTNDQYFKFP